MTYYSTTTLTSVRPPNAVEHDGRWWDTRPDAPDRDAHLAAVGVVPLVDTARPADTDTLTHDRTVALIDGAPTVVWTAREWTQTELDAQQAQVNAGIIGTAITDALTELDTLIAAPALPTVPAGTMTNAQLSDAVRALRDQAQATRAGAQRVARTLKQTIRLVRGDFAGID